MTLFWLLRFRRRKKFVANARRGTFSNIQEVHFSRESVEADSKCEQRRDYSTCSIFSALRG
jgi:hypothetical protein